MKTTGLVNSDAPGVYTITYTCTNHRGYPARPATRRVVVRDNFCPVCVVRGGPAVSEAGFAYHDAGAFFTDTVDGKITKGIQVISNVNTKRRGGVLRALKSRRGVGVPGMRSQ